MKREKKHVDHKLTNVLFLILPSCFRAAFHVCQRCNCGRRLWTSLSNRTVANCRFHVSRLGFRASGFGLRLQELAAKLVLSSQPNSNRILTVIYDIQRLIQRQYLLTSAIIFLLEN